MDHAFINPQELGYGHVITVTLFFQSPEYICHHRLIVYKHFEPA